MIMTSNILLNFSNFCIILCFSFTKLLKSGIIFLTAVNAAFAAKPVILGILFPNLVISNF